MNKIVLILVIFFLTLTSYGKERVEYDIKKLEKRDKIVYIIGEDEPYTGIFINKNYAGPLTETKYKNGLLHGETKEYHDNGRLAKLDMYKEGHLHGEIKKYYKNGRLEELITYKDGKREGAMKCYYTNGALKIDSLYKNGRVDGLQKIYYKTGELWSETKYKNGELIVETRWYNKDGTQIGVSTKKK